MELKHIKAKLDSAGDLFTLPQVLNEVLRLVERDDSSLKDIANIILKDVSLTAKILKVANSAFYGRTRQISTVNQAAVTLGLRAVKSLALSASIYDIVKNKNLELGFDPKLFWRHSLEVATASRMIATEIRYTPPEEAFVCGLLHDLGMIFLEKIFPEKYNEIWRGLKQGENLVDLENNLIGFNHCQTIKYIAEKWHLPINIVKAVENHHKEATMGQTKSDEVLWQTVSLANLLSKNVFDTLAQKQFEDYEQKEVLSSNLKISESTLSRISSSLFDEVIKVAENLEVDIGDPLELLQKANQDLYRIYITVEKLLKENQQMHEKLLEEEKKKIAMESLNALIATFSHYINNATTTILGRSQLIELALQNKEINDDSGKLSSSMKSIQKSVENISLVLEELKKLPALETVEYYKDSKIIDLEKNIRKKISVPT